MKINTTAIAALLFVCAIYSCKHTQQSAAPLPADPAAQVKDAGNTDNMQQNGVDFYGSGTDPINWELQMNFDDTVRFNADDGLSVKFGYNRLKKNAAAEQTLYTTKLEGGADVIITVIEKSCSTPLSKFAYSRQVSFSYNNKGYSGCGRFLVDNNLNNKWQLEKMNNKAIIAADYNRIPVFQFDLDKQKLTGNDGCNTIGGSFEVQGNRIKFNAIFSTKMGCMKKDISAVIGAQISDKLVNYYFKEGKLYLYLQDDSLLVFGKG